MPKGEEVRETCREWVDPKSNYCHEPAVVILWGKLFPREALGPRCEIHAEVHLPGHTLNEALRQHWAIFDLRNLRRHKK